MLVYKTSKKDKVSKRTLKFKNMKKNTDYNWFIRDATWYYEQKGKKIQLATLNMIKRGHESYNYLEIAINTTEELVYIIMFSKRSGLYARLKGSDDFDYLWDHMKNKLKLMVRDNITKNKTLK